MGSQIVAEARYTTTPANIDGRLDDPIWSECTTYELILPLAPPTNGQVPENPARVRFAWDDEYFYLACEFTDHDVVAEGNEDGLHHYRMGDLAELFLKPEAGHAVWELYLTPRGNQTTFFFPGRGRMGLPEHFESQPILKVAATVNGTLNNWQDTDSGWIGEMAVPISELRKHGGDFGVGVPWRVFVARYNYSYDLTLISGPELSSFPQLPIADWHDLDNYAQLKLIR